MHVLCLQCTCACVCVCVCVSTVVSISTVCDPFGGLSVQAFVLNVEGQVFDSWASPTIMTLKLLLARCKTALQLLPATRWVSDRPG